MASRVLIVVPTLARRLALLEESLASIANQTLAADIVLVAPRTPDTTALAERYSATLVNDPGSQTGAINAGVAFAGASHEFVNWLNDDDLLEPGSLATVAAALDAAPEAVVAYGACQYIDESGRELWVSRAGRWARAILPWGPDLIPQPGMLVRTGAFRAVGGVDESYRFAFDLDLLLRLRRLGPFVDVDTVVSRFRWHPESLTVSDRTTNLDESERAKFAHLGPVARRLSWTWRRPVRWATRAAAWEVTRRARRATAHA